VDRRTARRKMRFALTAHRTSAVVAVLVVGSIALASCTSNSNRTGTNPPATNAASTSSAPGAQFAVGACWQEDDYSTAVHWLTWEGSDQVDCKSSHNSITFAVTPLDEDFPYPVDAHGKLTEPTDEASAIVSFACLARAQDLVRPGAPEASMVEIEWYLPTPEQWKAGQRQVRCDLTLSAFDVTESKHEKRSMPATLDELATGLRSDPLAYEACALTAAGVAVGPFAEPTTTVVVRCDGPHTWRWLDRTEMKASAGAPFPGAAAVKAASTSACRNAMSDSNEAWWAFFPVAATWAAGDRSIDCWVGNDQPTI
jgi:hypothetical protein